MRVPRRWELWAVLLPLLVVYGLTLCRTVGPGDSTELTAALSTWGVPHAPGYPLLSLIGNVVSHVVPLPDPALTLNVLNAVIAALACAVVALAVSIATGNALAGVIAGLALGTSRVFWLHALALEVFGLNALVAATLLLVLSRRLAQRGAAAASWTLPLVALLLTTVLTHHATIVLLGLPVAIVALASGPAPSAGAPRRGALLVVLGLLPLAYVPIASSFHPLVNWGDVHDLPSLVSLLLRKDFGTGYLSPPTFVAAQVLRHGEQASPLHMRNLQLFLAHLPRDFGWGFLPLPVLGWLWAWRRRRPLLGLAVLFVAMLALFFTRVNLPRLPFFEAATERFLILPHVVLAYFAGLGVAWIAEVAPALRRVMLPALAATTSLAMLVVNWPRVDQHANTFVRDFAGNLLTGVPRDALFVTSGDLFQFGLSYRLGARRERGDVTLVSLDMIDHAWYQRQLTRDKHIRLPAEPTGHAGSLELLGANSDAAGIAGSRPVVVVKFADDTYRERFRLLPLGIWSRAIPTTQGVDPHAWLDAATNVVARWSLESLRRRYDDDAWERTEGIFYMYALGQLMGLRDLCEVTSPGRPLPEMPHAHLIESFDPHRRADMLAYEADFLAGCLTDCPAPIDSSSARTIARRAMDAARASLEIAPKNLQALQTKAALLASRPEMNDAARELDARRKIVEQTPGDLSELVPYFKLAIRAGALDDARRVQQRFVRLLRTADDLSPDEATKRAIERWSMPLELVADLR